MSTPEDSPPDPRPRPRQPRGRRTKLEMPGVKRQLIQELARGEKSYTQLARERNCDESSVREFRDRHQDEISLVAARLDDEFHGLWVASKTERMELIQDMVVRFLEDAENGDLDAAKFINDLLRKAAEEFGQIPTKTTVVQAQPLEVRIIGAEDV